MSYSDEKTNLLKPLRLLKWLVLLAVIGFGLLVIGQTVWERWQGDSWRRDLSRANKRIAAGGLNQAEADELCRVIGRGLYVGLCRYGAGHVGFPTDLEAMVEVNFIQQRPLNPYTGGPMQSIPLYHPSPGNYSYYTVPGETVFLLIMYGDQEKCHPAGPTLELAGIPVDNRGIAWWGSVGNSYHGGMSIEQLLELNRVVVPDLQTGSAIK